MRRVLLTLIAMVLSASAAAQTAAPKRLAWVGAQPRSGPLYSAFENRLRELGWRDGDNLDISYRRIERPDDYGPLLAEITRTAPDLVFAPGPEQALAAAKTVTRDVPIVFVAINYDPLARGHIAGFARPGGRLSGVFMQGTDITAKRVELVREAFPAARAIVLLWDSYGIEFLAPAEAAAHALGMAPRRIRVDDTSADLEARLKEAAASAAPVLVLGSPIFFRERVRIGALAKSLRVPIIGTLREQVEVGALMHFGPSLPAVFRRGADYVDKVLRGADPGSLPVEQPTRFELTINLGTARALGIELPAAILARADEVIE